MESSIVSAEIHVLKARCAVCGEPAPLTKRLSTDTSQVLVGGDDIYAPVCVRHFEE